MNFMKKSDVFSLWLLILNWQMWQVTVKRLPIIRSLLFMRGLWQKRRGLDQKQLKTNSISDLTKKKSFLWSSDNWDWSRLFKEQESRLDKKKQLVAKETTKEDQIRLKRELHKAEKNHDPFCKICEELDWNEAKKKQLVAPQRTIADLQRDHEEERERERKREKERERERKREREREREKEGKSKNRKRKQRTNRFVNKEGRL